MAYNQSNFKKHIETIRYDYFTMKSEVQAYQFIRWHEDRTERITISYRDYSPHGYYIDGISVDIYFNIIEKTLLKFKSDVLPNLFIGDCTIRKSMISFPQVDYSKFEKEINSESTFVEVVNQINTINQIGVIPFFEKYNTLQSVFDFTEKMPIEEMADFIVQPLPQRRMVIKKMCGDRNYQEYADMVLNFYKSEKDETWKEIEKLIKFLG